ncbi:MAG: outer membrane beta-barrel protein [Rhodobacteraceae bacterium]|nr:outer membrane beta-barrel protein [Paracoccaceae bacterium]
MKIENKIATGAVSVAALVAASTAVTAQDFTGPYVGVFAGIPSGSYPSVQDTTYGFETDFAAGGFVGFNLESNRGTIYGFEIAMHGTNLHDDDDDYDLQMLTDFKFKVGKSIDAFGSSMLLYGFAGASVASATTDNLDYSYAAFGVNFGAGVEYMLSDTISVGLEHTQRSMLGHYTEGTGVANGTTSFRVAIRF